MANFRSIARLHPEYPDFIRRGSLMHRGDVIVFRPDRRTPYFSTDKAGFRHSVFKSEEMAARDVVQREHYGLVLGSSHIFGLGMAGDENTIPSLLGERFGFPFANVSLPEGNSRNLFSLLFAFLARAPHQPKVVVHFSGGDFTGFCYTSIADPIFGSPNLKQLPMVVEERGGQPVAEHYIQPLLAFTSLWTRSIAQLCRTAKIPLVLGHDTTFFEKRSPRSEIEVQCKLGEPSNKMQERWFATHKPFFPKFLERRELLAAKLGVPLVGPGPSNDYGFIDEFHYDRDSTRALFEDVAKAVKPLLGKS